MNDDLDPLDPIVDPLIDTDDDTYLPHHDTIDAIVGIPPTISLEEAAKEEEEEDGPSFDFDGMSEDDWESND